MVKHSLSKFRKGRHTPKKSPEIPKAETPKSPPNPSESPAQAVHEASQWTAPEVRAEPQHRPQPMTAPPPESLLASPEGSSHGEPDVSARIAQLDVLEPAGAGAGGGDAGGEFSGAPVAPAAALTREQFNDFLGVSFGAVGLGASAVTRNKGWEALAIAPPEQQGFKQFTDSMYHLAVKWPQYFGWMIRPENETIQAAVIIVTFSVGKAKVVRAAIAANKPTHRPAPARAPVEEAAGLQ